MGWAGGCSLHTGQKITVTPKTAASEAKPVSMVPRDDTAKQAEAPVRDFVHHYTLDK
ncbi:hypothetical protein [Paenibacillus sp. N3.4]|uniref:hypothetical protein n=1 Tax=Paenibacillus sp. N3.4 TaxID=2603222 RepID=UPI00164F23A6|nr:hypothetical protein [Paenibacillus sp. N3.4]